MHYAEAMHLYLYGLLLLEQISRLESDEGYRYTRCLDQKLRCMDGGYELNTAGHRPTALTTTREREDEVNGNKREQDRHVDILQNEAVDEKKRP